MGIFSDKEPKKILSKKKEIYCCQCHRKISECYVKPDKEDSFMDIFQVCPACFIELSVYINMKEKENKK